MLNVAICEGTESMMRSWWVIAPLLFFLLSPSLAFADPLCWLRTTSPFDAVIKGLSEIGPEWKVYKLSKPFKVSAHVYEVELLLKRSDFKFVDLKNSEEYPESFNRWVPKNLRTGQVQLFEVRVRNTKLGWVDLVYTSTGYPPANDNAFVALGFTNHPDKNRFFIRRTV